MPIIDLGSALLNYIVDTGLQPGDRLPSISELADADHLGSSASKVREQLEVARALGLVEVRSKTGTRLREYSFAPAVRLGLLYAIAQNPALFDRFSQLRIHVEVAFWREACGALTEADKQTMRDCVDSAHEKLTGERIRIPYAEHHTFHMTVFKRLENPFVMGILEAYWDAYRALQLNLYADYEYLHTTWDYHARILEAIQAGDQEASLSAYIEHTKLIRYMPRPQDQKGEMIIPDAPDSFIPEDF